MTQRNSNQLKIVLVLLVGALLYVSPYAISTTGAAANYRNVTIGTTLNITNSLPEVLAVFMSNQTLTAGGVKSVQCNFTVRDFDGVADLNFTNATFFDQNVATLTSPDDNNDHYINSSCTLYNNDSITANYTCQFDVSYYANNGSNWNCTAIVVDDKTTLGNGSNTTTIYSLLALNVTPNLIDYGNLQVGDISSAQEANVTNFGNIEINVTVRGYGDTEGDNLAMVCDQNNIPIDEERFNKDSGVPWADMVQMSSSNQMLSNVTLIQRTNDTAGGEVYNSTYWTIRVPTSTNPSGRCNGTLVFQAELS